MKHTLFASALCAALALAAPRADATGCSLPSECSSGFCVSGVCCDTKCDGACHACSAAAKGSGVDGTCGTIAGCTTCTVDGECASTEWCDTGACKPKKANGQVATDKRACTSGLLADGVCCDTACTGICEACDLDASKGTCTAVSGSGKHGSCPTGADACGAATCDGIARDKCDKFPGSSVSCRAAACAEGTETLSASCDGKGACPAVETKKCGAYACDGNRCRTTCRSTFDCASGKICDDITKQCVDSNTCDGDHTIAGLNGAKQDCSPFKCDKTKCLENCTATSQCVTGYVCNGSLCVPPEPPPVEDDGGCAMSPRRSGMFGALLGLALLARIARKRR